jgi:seryl-tRNA synthetase
MVISPSEFLRALCDHKILFETGVDGIYGRGGSFERALLGFEGLLTTRMAPDHADLLRFPPVIPRRDMETAGYLSSFPHLAGSVFSFTGDEAEARTLGSLAKEHGDWSALQTQTEVCLTPAACYPIYPWLAAQGAVAADGRLIDVSSFCFRHEPSDDPARMQSFRMREHVKIGTQSQVEAWHSGWSERGADILRSVGLETTEAPASDPFFGRTGRMLAANQVAQGFKLERSYLIAGSRPTPVMSLNYHHDHFSHDFDLKGPGGEPIHSACVAFGLDRVALALFSAHGLDDTKWPADVRGHLGLDELP